MILKEEDKFKIFIPSQHEYLGKGIEGKVYVDEEYAVKLFHSETSSIIEEKSAIHMTNINTERFLLPQKLIYNRNDQFIGYKTKLMLSEDKNQIFYLPKKDLIDNFDVLIKELTRLAEQSVVIDDNSFDNMSYNKKKIYFIDPGAYFYDESDSMMFYGRFRSNYEALNDFLEELLSKAAIKNKDISYNLREIIEEEDMISERLRKDMKENENILTYAKRV